MQPVEHPWKTPISLRFKVRTEPGGAAANATFGLQNIVINNSPLSYKLSFQNTNGTEVASLSQNGELTLSSLTANGPVYSNNGTLNSEQYLSTVRGGTGLDTSEATNGELLIGNGAGLSLGYLTGTPNQISIASTAGAINFSLPQDIALTSTPTFAALSLTNSVNQLTLGTTGAITTVNSAATGNQTVTIPALLNLTPTLLFLPAKPKLYRIKPSAQAAWCFRV